MALSRKYGQNGKTFHVPYSKGTDSTDRKNWEYWDNIVNGVKAGQASYKTLDVEDGSTVENTSVAQDPIKELVFTEKLDGQGNCFNQYGLFARSHAAPSELPWDRTLREKWSLIKNDLKDFGIELFGEGMFARHSITYLRLEHDFYMFAARKGDQWLSWEEVCYWAEMFDFPVVPVISQRPVSDFENQTQLQSYVEELMGGQSSLGSIDTHSFEFDQHEGVVFRNVEGYHVNNFIHNLFKIVRKGHVKTDEHWTRNWKVAPKKWELESILGKADATPEEYREAIVEFDKRRSK